MNGKAGLYIHIPFCASKCPYCDFYSVRYDENAAEEYVERLCAEFKNTGARHLIQSISAGAHPVCSIQN